MRCDPGALAQTNGTGVAVAAGPGVGVFVESGANVAADPKVAVGVADWAIGAARGARSRQTSAAKPATSATVTRSATPRANQAREMRTRARICPQKDGSSEGILRSHRNYQRRAVVRLAPQHNP